MRKIRFHDASKHNTVNLLSDLTPVFSGWNTNPGTNADITNELIATLTTSGIQTNSTDSTVTYDLGASYRIVASVMRGTVGTGSNVRLLLSDDDISYSTVQASGAATAARTGCTAVGKARYIQAMFIGTATGNTMSNLSMKVYRI